MRKTGIIPVFLRKKLIFFTWNIRMWSINCTTLSAHMGDACNPAAAMSGATWSGMEHWLAFRTNNSDHTSLNRATCNTKNKFLSPGDKFFNFLGYTWSVTCRSGKNGIFLAHSTAEKSKRAASSQILSMPIMLFAWMHCPYRLVG